MEKTISNWGNYPKIKGTTTSFTKEEELKRLMLSDQEVIARGMGRSYGDASLGKSMVSTRQFNKIIDFDSTNGTINCESGVSLEEILELIVLEGWFLPVTPGTKFVSVGGAVAADIHGKNHHIHGSFSSYVISFRIMLENGTVLLCSKEENTDLFYATIGGMGLTGIILDAKFKLLKVETSYISQRVTCCKNLEEMLREIDASTASTYSVAWVDCFSNGDIGKGILFTGEHTLKSELATSINPLAVHQKQKFKVPFYFPSFLLNRWTIKLFNIFYYWMQSRKEGVGIANYDQFFYPLDMIKDWNKIYGRNGFIQYQMVVPVRNGQKALTQVLQLINDRGYGSFLCVLKLLGDKSGLIAFPEPGYTLSLDFPVNDKVFKLVEELDEIVQHFDGKIYLAKDSRLKNTNFERMYKELDEFNKVRKKYNPNSKFQSSLSHRLNLTK
jgi:FAD/FMN-containing dehydrogenase